MGLLNELFPELIGFAQEGLPQWGDEDSPWQILNDDEMGMKVQMLELLGGQDVYVHPSAIISENVKLEGPCYVGPGAEIRFGAFLRAGSWICSGALVGHSSEIKNSILLPGSKAPHFNYVGDSILGFSVNLGAGAKLSNVRNDKREIRITLEDGSKIDTGLNKLGAMVGDGSQIGCNVVTNPGTIIPAGSSISPNASAYGWMGIKS